MPRERPRRKLSVPEVARRFGISEDKVRAWIGSGELRAVNAATRPSGRPRWLIDEDDLAAFERARSSVARVSAPSSPRRRRAGGVIEFF